MTRMKTAKALGRTAMTFALLLFIICCFSLAAAAEDWQTVFQKDSYWELTYYSYAEGNPVSARYFVELAGMDNCNWVNIVSEREDDLIRDKYGWRYDAARKTVEISALKDGWDSGVFALEGDVFVSEGAYHRMVLTHSQGAEAKYRLAMVSFGLNYGSFNAPKRLVTSNSHFRYLDLSAIDAMGYDNFRYMATVKSPGIVNAATEDEKESICSELAPLVGLFAPDDTRLNKVLLDVEFPEKDEGVIYVNTHADIINLVYYDRGMEWNAYEQLCGSGEKLLTSGPATGGNSTSNDLYDAEFFWNDTQAVTIYRIGSSIVIFRGPTQDVRNMTEYLNMDSELWY